MAEEWKEQYDYYFDKVNNANVESAKKQMLFQERMSSTAHQREVKDLIAAGLNPVLSANNGASSPMGAYANVDSSPISAKFARQNLNKELENARLIQAMQNDNAMAIAMQQIGAQLQMQKYTTDENNRTSRFNTIVQEYGPLAGLVYGMTEGMYDGLPGVNNAISALSNNNNTLQGLIDGVGSSSKLSKAVSDLADKFLNGLHEGNVTKYFYGDNTILDNDSAQNKKIYDALAKKAVAKIASQNTMRPTSIPRKIVKAKKFSDHTKAFNKFVYR